MAIMVNIKGLSKHFGHFPAVNDIAFTINRGEVLGLLGPNGSGKSTTMKMATGFLLPTTGTVEICGIDMSANPIDAQRHIGYLPEGASTYPDLTPHEYLTFIADTRHINGAEASLAIDNAITKTNIEQVQHQPIGTLSKGYKRRLGLAQALLHDPDVLILDEPTDGLDPNQKREVRKLIAEISPHKAIIISTHLLEEVDAICSRVLIIAEGKIVANGTPEELKQQSKYFHAVCLTVPASHAYDVITTLKGNMPNTKIDSSASRQNAVDVIVFEEQGNDVLPTVITLSQEYHWPVERITHRQGDLDDVFSQLTQSPSITMDENPPPKKTETSTPRSSSSETFHYHPAASVGVITLRDAWSVCRRELISYLSTPIAYVFVVVFLATIGAFTFFLGGFFTQGQASLDTFFQFHPWLYLFFIPAITMRLWAEERANGSIEILLTLPISTLSTVLGKFLSAWIVVGLALLMTTTIWFTVNYLGTPDNGAIAAGYLGSFFMAGGYLAIGACMSSVTNNQIVAFILATLLCFIFTASGLSVVLEFFNGWAPPWVLETIANFSFLTHFRDISRGVVDIQNITFFSSTILFFLYANFVAVEHSKAA
ncbi:ATP-binding cassette domain-containing protein [Enterovibrio norvegicus]|uniref:ATP-binding cassette domain-containing protein n=1 Tax=Enterovibrio norvegicus TaxID=188144 RepID=UPI00030E8238|nr:ATP-binding cassette domain-containing protein [Enterovibrio norvegicus]